MAGNIADSYRFWDRAGLLPVLGLVLGSAVGVADHLVLKWIGISVVMAEMDVAPAVFLFFGATYAAMGFLVGSLVDQRRRLLLKNQVIADQMEALAAGQRALVQQEKLAAVGRVAAGIAHEVRNPLGVIRASASLAEGDMPVGSEAQRALRFIVEEVDRLNALVTALLNFCKPLSPFLEPIQVPVVVSNAVVLAESALRDGGAHLEMDLPSSMPTLATDRDLLCQILLNLLVNAAQAIPSGGCVLVRAAVEGPGLVLAVLDDGPGVSPDHLSRLTEPFFTTRAGGTGLGLAMADRMSALLGARLKYVPGRGLGPDGRGACFQLTLPLSGQGGIP